MNRSFTGRTRKIFFAVLLTAIAAALVIIGCSKDDDDDNGGKGNGGGVIDINTYDADYAVFKKAMADAINVGKGFDAKGLAFQAQSVYSFAGASLSAARFAVENLLAQKGAGSLAEVSAGSRYANWDSIAAVSYSSPYPYYFEGLLAHIAGEDGKAVGLYVNAMMNPAYPDSGVSFYYLKNKTAAELNAIRDELRTLETSAHALITSAPAKITRDEYTFYPDYLRAKSKEALAAGNNAAAVAYAKNAVMTDPFDVANYKGAAVTLMAAEEFVSAAEYLDMGLSIAPEDAGLKLLYNILKQTSEQGASGLSKKSGLATSAASAALAKAMFVPWGAGSLEGVDYVNIHYEPKSDAEKQELRARDICVKDLTAEEVDAIIRNVMNARWITSGMLINAIALINAMGAESFGWEDVIDVAAQLTGADDVIELYEAVMGTPQQAADGIKDYVAGQVKDKLQDAAEEAVGKITVKVGARLGLKVSPLGVFFKAVDIGEIGAELYAKYERIEDALKVGEEKYQMLADFYAACNAEIVIAAMNSEEYDCCDDLEDAEARAECKCAKPQNAGTLECVCRADPEDERCQPCAEAPGTLKCFCEANPEHAECKKDDDDDKDPCEIDPYSLECTRERCKLNPNAYGCGICDTHPYSNACFCEWEPNDPSCVCYNNPNSSECKIVNVTVGHCSPFDEGFRICSMYFDRDVLINVESNIISDVDDDKYTFQYVWNSDEYPDRWKYGVFIYVKSLTVTLSSGRYIFEPSVITFGDND